MRWKDLVDYNLYGKNCQVKEGYKIKDRDIMKEFCQDILSISPFTNRSIDSYVREWRAHNLLYDMHIARERTRYCYLNADESILFRIGYFFLSLFYLKGNKKHE